MGKAVLLSLILHTISIAIASQSSTERCADFLSSSQLPTMKDKTKAWLHLHPYSCRNTAFSGDGIGIIEWNFPTQNIPTRSRFGIGQYDRCLWKGFICKGCRYFLWLTMNELPVIGSLRLRTGFWDHHGANIATRLGYGERLFRRPKKWFWRGIIAFSPQFHHKLAKIMSIRGKCKFLS